MVHQGDHVTLCSIYAPDTPGERPDFFEFLKSELVNFRPRGPLILGGDFNFVINPTSDRVGENIYRPQFIRGRDEFYDIINLFDLFDPFRVRQGGQQGGQREYTWSNNAGSIRSRLDRFYAPLDSEMAEIKHLNSNLSDHRPVQLKFQSRKQERGQGCWKLNTLVLEEWEYRDRVEGALAAAKYRKDHVQLDEWWDEIKAQIAEISKSYCKRRAKRLRSLKNDLTATREKLLEKEIRTEEDEKQLSDLTEELDQLHREKAMGAQIRSGQDLAELMERPNAYFYGAEKKRSEAKMMKELNIDGERVCDQTRIREHVRIPWKNTSLMSIIGVSGRRVALLPHKSKH